MVEPTQEVIVHEDVTPKWFCRCETPDGVRWHELDERECPVCGGDGSVFAGLRGPDLRD